MRGRGGPSRIGQAATTRLDAQARHRLRIALDDLAAAWKPRRGWRGYYYEDLYGFIRTQVPRGARVLDLGCGDGALLAGLRPSFGVGVDLSGVALRRAAASYPHLHFVCADIEELPLAGPFDYVIVSNTVGYLFDVWAFFRGLKAVVGPETRIIVTYYNFVWEPMLEVAERLGVKNREPLQNWLSRLDLVNLLELSDFELVATDYRTPIPIGPTSLIRPLNRVLSALPLVRRFGITSYAVARPGNRRAVPRVEEPTCSIVIPTRNERGNIQPLIERLPSFAASVELLFVDGESTDGTVAEIERVMREHPELDIKLLHQGNAAGKGDAVRKGFDAATGDVLAILDADLSVPPEDLPKFWAVLTEERAEFVNGSRLVYPMERQAMRLANILGNKFFSLAFSWILGQRVTDTLCGTKMLWARDYRRLAESRAEFGDFDPFGDFDLLFGAARLRLKMREVPIRYRARSYGTTNIARWRHGLLLLRMSLIGARKLKLR
jgi:SAM-dependent methyltransferase